MIVAIAGRRAATARILLDAALGDAGHSYTADPANADVVVLFDAADLSDLRQGAVVVAYADDASVLEATRGLTTRVVTFGLSSGSEVRAESIESTLERTAFTMLRGESSTAVSVGIAGESVVPLVLAALVVAAVAETPGARAIAALAGVDTAAPHDMQRDSLEGVIVIDDSGDTTPRGTADALKALAQFTTDGTRSVAVLGELDLPADTDALESREQHDRIGRLVVRLNVSRLVVVGQRARHIHNAAGLEGSWDGESVLVDDLDEAYAVLNDFELATHDASPAVVLVKTSGLTALINQPRRATL